MSDQLQEHRNTKMSHWSYLITPFQGISTLKPCHSEDVRAFPGSASSSNLVAGLAVGSWPALGGGI